MGGRMTGRKRGFSLLEVTVSLVTVLVFASVSLPMANTTINTYRLRSDTHQVAAQCQNTRFLAISSNVPHRLHLNGNVIEIQKLVSGTYTRVDSYRLSQGITVSSAWSADPVFSPRGTVSSSASVTFASNAGATRTVSISVTGLVHEQ